MLPINLLQSQLAHNKKRINELQYVVSKIKSRLFRINQDIIVCDDYRELYLAALKSDRASTLKDLQKTRKQLKQLAILQKSIKFEINQQSFWLANLVKQAMKNIEGA